MSQKAKKSPIEIESVSSLTSGGSAEHGIRKPVDVEARIEEEGDDTAAALEHDQEAQEDDDVNRAARNDAVATNYRRG